MAATAGPGAVVVGEDPRGAGGALVDAQDVTVVDLPVVDRPGQVGLCCEDGVVGGLVALGGGVQRRLTVQGHDDGRPEVTACQGTPLVLGGEVLVAIGVDLEGDG